MYHPVHQNDMSQVGQDRILDLYETAAELRVSRRDGTGRTGLLGRARLSLGRRLVSVGSAVAGGHA